MVSGAGSGSSRGRQPRQADPEDDAALGVFQSINALQTLLRKYEGKIRQQVGVRLGGRLRWGGVGVKVGGVIGLC